MSVGVASLFLVSGHCASLEDLHETELKQAALIVYRKIDGEVFDLTPRLYYARDNSLFAYQPLARFEFIHGKVLSVGTDGILLRRYAESDLLFEEEYKLVYVKNFPYAAIDNQHVAFYAVKSGTYSYLSAANSRNTVRCYDFGTIPSDSEISEAKMKAKERAENYQKSMSDLKATNDLIQSKRDSESKSATIKFLKEKAAEGAPMAQYRLAEKYLKGDGVPRDVEQAKFWLEASCTNGYVEASNLLHKIKN